MAFDAETLLAAFEKPVYISKTGKRTIGKPLSHPQYQKMLADLRVAGDDEAKAEPVLKQALTDMGLPADEILVLPEPLYWKALRDFFRCCRGEPSVPANPSTPGPATPSTPE